MKIYQVFNAHKGAYIKIKQTNKGSQIMNVKQKEPAKPFKGIPVRR